MSQANRRIAKNYIGEADTHLRGLDKWLSATLPLVHAEVSEQIKATRKALADLGSAADKSILEHPGAHEESPLPKAGK